MSKTRESRVIVVVGMGRSGTSTISRGLMALGVYLGNNLIEAASINERGFWEDADIVALNEEIFANCEKNWGSVDDIDLNRLDAEKHRQLLEKAKDLILKRYGGISVWGFKDPRTVRVLPFWREVFHELGIHDDYVICYRNPVSVVASFSRISTQSNGKSYLQWLNRSFLALEGTNGKRRVVVNYDNLMSSPVEELERVARVLNIATYSQDQLDDYRCEFLQQDLRHSVSTIEELKAINGLPEIFADLARFMESAAQGEALPRMDESHEVWSRIRLKYSALKAWRESLDAEGSELAALQTAKEWLESQYKAWMATAEAREREIGSLLEAKEWLESQYKAWMATAEAREREIGSLLEAKEWLESQYKAWMATAEARECRVMVIEKDNQIKLLSNADPVGAAEHPQVSCVMTFHAEGVLAHWSLFGFQRVRDYAEQRGVSVELVAVLDSADAETVRIVRQHPVVRASDQVVEVVNRDSGASRNSGISAARGEYIAICDGDDYCSENWFVEALRKINETGTSAIVHPELVLSFGRVHCVARVMDQQRDDYPLASCLKVHPWVVTAFAHRGIFQRVPYEYADAKNTGFGYEDWHWNLETLTAGSVHVVAPRTALFYRTKQVSRLTEHAGGSALVRPSRFFDHPERWFA